MTLGLVWLLAIALLDVAAFAQQSDGPAESTTTAESSESVAPPAGVEIMKVKGRAVSGIETDVPESVTQFDAATIDALGAANIADLAKVTPNVEIRSAGSTTATFFIRGVGLADFSANAAGAVGIFQDDIQLNAPAIQLGQLFDTENVNVKRGPQGHGLFRNSSAGAIRIFAKKPTGEYEAKLRTSFSSFWTDDARDAFIRDTEGALNLPLVEDMLATRVAFRVRGRDPYITNGCAGAIPLAEREQFDASFGGDPTQGSICGERADRAAPPQAGQVSHVPPGLEKYLGEKDDWAIRGALRFSPPESNTEILLNIHGSRLEEDSTVGEVIGSRLDSDGNGGSTARFGDVSKNGYQQPEQLAELQDIAERNSGLTWDEINSATVLDGLTAQESADLRAEVIRTSYDELGKNLAEDRVLDREPYRGDYNNPGRTTLDTVGGYLRGIFTVGDDIDTQLTLGTEHYERFRDSDVDFSPAAAIEQVITDRAKQLTFDAEFSGDAFDGAVRWKLGNATLFERLQFLAYTRTHPTRDPIRRKFRQNTAAFVTSAEFSWDFLEDFTLTVGGRWNYETKDFRMRELLARGVSAVTDNPEIDRERQKTWQAPTGAIALTYHITDETTLFSKYSRGFKAGHFNSNSGQEVWHPGPAKPENIDAFEWGFSASFFERRISSRGSFFFYKYQNYQVFVFAEEPGSVSPPSLVIRNAREVQQFGAELDLTVKPLLDWAPDEYDDLKFVVRFGWLDSEFLEFANFVPRQDGIFDFLLAVDYRGAPLINSPEFKVSGSVEWPLDLSEWGTITPRYDVEWSDDIFFDASQGRGALDANGKVIQPKFALGQPERIIHNISLSYRTPVGNVEVRGWVRNILDTRYKTFAFDVSAFAGSIINFVAEPRSAGADVTVTW